MTDNQPRGTFEASEAYASDAIHAYLEVLNGLEEGDHSVTADDVKQAEDAAVARAEYRAKHMRVVDARIAASKSGLDPQRCSANEAAVAAVTLGVMDQSGWEQYEHEAFIAEWYATQRRVQDVKDEAKARERRKELRLMEQPAYANAGEPEDDPGARAKKRPKKVEPPKPKRSEQETISLFENMLDQYMAKRKEKDGQAGS